MKQHQWIASKGDYCTRTPTTPRGPFTAAYSLHCSYHFPPSCSLAAQLAVGHQCITEGTSRNTTDIICCFSRHRPIVIQFQCQLFLGSSVVLHGCSWLCWVHLYCCFSSSFEKIRRTGKKRNTFHTLSADFNLWSGNQLVNHADLSLHPKSSTNWPEGTRWVAT